MFRSLATLATACRLGWIALGLVIGVMSSSTVQAQAPAAPAPAAQAAPPTKRVFSGDGAMILNFIKPDKTADFESVWTTIKEKLAKNEKADLKELAESIKIYKVNAVAAAGAPPPTQVLYLFELNPPSKTLSYDPVKLIYESGSFPDRPEADALYKKLGESLAGGINLWPLSKVGG